MSGGTIFIGVLVLIGLTVLGVAGNAWRKAQVAKTWPVAEGQILASEVKMNSSPNATPTFNAEVRYQYTVNGQRYEGNRVAFGYIADSDDDLHGSIVRRLPVGTAVGVRYAPNDPTQAVLAVGLNPPIRMSLIFGSVWTAFSLALGFMVLTGGRSAGPANTIVESLILR